jgi:hypothetical protein
LSTPAGEWRLMDNSLEAGALTVLCALSHTPLTFVLSSAPLHALHSLVGLVAAFSTRVAHPRSSCLLAGAGGGGGDGSGAGGGECGLTCGARVSPSRSVSCWVAFIGGGLSHPSVGCRGLCWGPLLCVGLSPLPPAPGPRPPPPPLCVWSYSLRSGLRRHCGELSAQLWFYVFYSLFAWLSAVPSCARLF